jgi:Tfp pilus assembly protein PilX
MPNRTKIGVILFIVVGVILVVSILAILVLGVVSSQARLTHHQISRIQAQYVAKAGMVYALEMLRKGTAAGGWGYSVAPPVNSCRNATGGCLVTDPNFPSSVVNQQFRIIFCPAGSTCQYTSDPCTPPPGSNFCVNSTAVFTYTP